jgi:hypothetical protein
MVAGAGVGRTSTLETKLFLTAVTVPRAKIQHMFTTLLMELWHVLHRHLEGNVTVLKRHPLNSVQFFLISEECRWRTTLKAYELESEMCAGPRASW